MSRIAADTLIGGRYRVIEHLGTGGMADVYSAHDMQLGRTVAFKLLHDRFASDEEFVKRFMREASSAAGLAHQHVVAIYERGEWEGSSYIAMEFVSGRTLQQIVAEEGPLEPQRAVAVTVQILSAARFAHRRGIIHRDFKPQNVIVDDEGCAKVTDFGIARAAASDMTPTGPILGTAQYLSPEQVQGHAVSARSDLYSIGIILYELLTGRVPFIGESAVTVALKQASEAPIPPRELNPRVTRELESVVLHALEKDPEKRFASADEFIVALQAISSPIPTPAAIAASARRQADVVVPSPAPAATTVAWRPTRAAAHAGDRRDRVFRREMIWAVQVLEICACVLLISALSRSAEWWWAAAAVLALALLASARNYALVAPNNASRQRRRPSELVLRSGGLTLLRAPARSPRTASALRSGRRGPTSWQRVLSSGGFSLLRQDDTHDA